MGSCSGYESNKEMVQVTKEMILDEVPTTRHLSSKVYNITMTYESMRYVPNL
jgi:hypothetical protein